MARISFIGLGNMGKLMSQCLLRAGHDVTGFDIVEVLREAHARGGGRIADSVAAAVRDQDVVISMVPTGLHVRELYEGNGGVLENAAPGTLLIDSSTIDVESAKAVNQAAADKGLRMIDAPVAGSVPAAQKGALTFMVGGTEEAYLAAVPILKSMGTAVFHIGAAGSGQALKICNNMMTGMAVVATSEMFVLAEKLGLDYQTVFDVVSLGSGNSWVLQNYCPVPGPVSSSPASRGYEASFTMAMMLKDMRLSQAAADAMQASTPLAAAAAALYQMGVVNGFAGKDCSFIFNVLSGRTHADALDTGERQK